MAQSIEPNIAELANGWLKSYNLPYKLEKESVNFEIDKALSDYFSKNGGAGANRPDTKILIQDKNLNFYPVLIEYKGHKGNLVKLDASNQVENRTSKNEPHFKNINSFAVNGAVHYANALLHHTSYTEIIAIGMTGYKDERGNIQHEIGVYCVSKNNFGVGQKVGEFSDFSFLAPKNFDAFIDKDKYLSSRRGQFTERNTAFTPWNTNLDFRFSQDFKVGNGKRKQVITFTYDIINLTNLLNKKWGQYYFSANTFNSTASVGLAPASGGTPSFANVATTYPKYTFQDPGLPYSVDLFASRWQMQFGVRYTF